MNGEIKYLFIFNLTLMNIFSGGINNYDPNPLQYSNFNDRGEIKINANFGFLNGMVADVGGIGLSSSLSASFTKSLFGFVSIFKKTGDYDSKTMFGDTKNQSVDNLYGDGGIGIYGHNDSKSINCYQILIGYGLGKHHRSIGFEEIRNDEEIKSGLFKRGFLQANFGKKNERFEYGLANRLSYIRFPNLKSEDINSGNSWNEKNVVLMNIEPAFYFKYGDENINIGTQFGYSILTNDISGGDAGGIIFSVGVEFIIDTKKM